MQVEISSFSADDSSLEGDTSAASGSGLTEVSFKELLDSLLEQRCFVSRASRVKMQTTARAPTTQRMVTRVADGPSVSVPPRTVALVAMMVLEVLEVLAVLEVLTVVDVEVELEVCVNEVDVVVIEVVDVVMVHRLGSIRRIEVASYGRA